MAKPKSTPHRMPGSPSTYRQRFNVRWIDSRLEVFSSMTFAHSSVISVAILIAFSASALAADAPDYARDVAPILTKYCTGCHNDTDREGKLSLQSYASLLKGGAKGGVVTPGQAELSRLIRV